MSKLQADGLVSQNRSLQKPSGRNEVQTRGQNQGTQSNMQKLYQTGKKLGNQVNNAQKSPKTVQKPGNQINNTQTSLQTVQKQGNQTNVPKEKHIRQKTGNPANNANNAQRLQQNGQRTGIQTNNANKTQQVNNLQKSQMGNNEMQSKTGQKVNITNNTSQLQGSSNSKNPLLGNKFHQPVKKQGQKDQTGKSIRNEQPVGRSGSSQGEKCQSDLSFRTDSTLPVDGNNKSKPGEVERSRFFINDVDFLVGYSTMPGNLSYRHEQTGSWYLDALYQNLKKNHSKYDIMSILEDVNYDVCCKKDQYNFIDFSSQVSMFSSTLRGPVLFP